MAIRAAQVMGLDIAGVDMLRGEDGPMVIEINSSPGLEGIEAATGLLLLAAVFQLPDGLQISAAGALRGLKDTRIPMLFTLVAYWGIGLPLAWTLGIALEWGARGTWIGLIAGLSTAAVLLFARFDRLTRFDPRTPDVGGPGVA